MTDRQTAAALSADTLVALVGSRISHDLASPIGAIANGVELLGLTGLDGSPELALITESVENASARIKLFRIAFGAARPGQTLSAAEIVALTGPARDNRKLTIDWPVSGEVARQEAKLITLALMCLETAMPWGGAAQVRHTATGIEISAETGRLALDAPLWAHLTGASKAEVAAAQVQFLLLPAEAAAQGRTLRLDSSDTHITITL